MDVVSWDSYPGINTPPSSTAFRNDLMRGLKQGKPFMLMEQTPSQLNWQPFNSLKRPGVMRLQSYQAVAHGADTVMFFQLRRSFGACEKYHGALIAHAGYENTRVFRECQQLGEELSKLKDKTIDSVIKSRAAIVFDWDNWWAVEFSSGPSVMLRYVQQVEKYYRAFYNMNASVDIISPDMDMSGYDIVVAPVLYMIKPGVADNIKNFVSKGGAFVTTFFSGLVNENDLVTLGGYPGELRDLLGIWVEEIDALTPEMKNNIKMVSPFGELEGEYQCGMLCDLINLEGAEAYGVYGKDFYEGRPALTINKYGNGEAYYVASDPEQGFLDKLIRAICSSKNIMPPFEAPVGIEITQRVKGNREFTFVLNHNEDTSFIELNGEFVDIITDKKLAGKVSIDKKGVLILEKEVTEE
jgi:beta-galactosidase